MRLSSVKVKEAIKIINPIFLNSPQFIAERLGGKLGCILHLKVETLNPIRSFKGRGADYFFSTLQDDREVVCASVGNFGQGMAYAARSRGRKLTVFASKNANPLKIESMRAFGANVILEGDDFEEAKAAGAHYARERNALFIEDGKDPAISEGAGTIALEMLAKSDLDYLVIPLGNGALINGMGTYAKQASPKTKIIGVVASGAPAMLLSWKEDRIVETGKITTIADGIAIRIPVVEALEDLKQVVDEIVEVADDTLIKAMRLSLFDWGLALEPAGASGLAAILDDPTRFAGKKVGTVLSGGNINPLQLKTWLFKE
jgi:threonine dehydratase